MRIGFRDLAFAGCGVLLGCSGWAMAQESQPVLGPAVFNFDSMPVKTTEVGKVRSVVRQPTATLRELEIHVTTLNPGKAPHGPHRHPNEELIIIDQGTVETLSDGKWIKAGPGSIIFNASNALHTLHNVGTAPARYHVINWATAATPAS